MPVSQNYDFRSESSTYGEFKADMFILHLCLKSDIVVWSRVTFYRHTIWPEMEKNSPDFQAFVKYRGTDDQNSGT